MPRRRTIYVDEMPLLARIVKHFDETQNFLQSEAERLEADFYETRRNEAWTSACSYRSMHKENAELGIKYDLPEFLGYFPTPSQRIRGQEAIRRLEASGFVVLYGDRASRLSITRKGRSALESKPSDHKPATEAAANE